STLFLFSPLHISLLLLMLPPPTSKLFPYTTLFRSQIQGFFDIPVDNVYASPVLLGDVWKQEYENMVVVSPDVGGVVRARALAKRDRKSTRLNSSHVKISYAVFCLKKKKRDEQRNRP